MTDVRSIRPGEPGLPGREPNGGTPPEHLICIGQAELVRFTASPSTTTPFGGPVKLSWTVQVPPGCAGMAVDLNGKLVRPSGSMEVEPVDTTTYRIEVRMGRAHRVLGSTTVRVETEACTVEDIPESLVRSQFRSVVEGLVEEASELRLRRAPTISVGAAGIDVAIRLKVDVSNFADPDLDVDFLLGLRLRDGEVEPYFRRFDVDVSWPWWVTAITLGVTRFVERVVERRIERELRSQVVDAVKARLDALADQLPGDLRIQRLRTVDGSIEVTACPVGDHTPHLVPGSGGVAPPPVHLR